MLQVYNNHYVQLSQVTRVYMETKIDFSGSYTTSYCNVYIELSSGFVYKYDFIDENKAKEYLRDLISAIKEAT